MGLSLVSLVGLTAFVGSCSWSRLNLDSEAAAQDPRSPPREHQKRRTYTRNDGFNVHRDPYTQTFEQTVFPGNYTGIARDDTAKSDSPGYVSHSRTLV